MKELSVATIAKKDMTECFIAQYVLIVLAFKKISLCTSCTSCAIAIRRHHTFRFYEKHLKFWALVGLLIVFRHDKLLV